MGSATSPPGPPHPPHDTPPRAPPPADRLGWAGLGALDTDIHIDIRLEDLLVVIESLAGDDFGWSLCKPSVRAWQPVGRPATNILFIEANGTVYMCVNIDLFGLKTTIPCIAMRRLRIVTRRRFCCAWCCNSVTVIRNIVTISFSCVDSLPILNVVTTDLFLCANKINTTFEMQTLPFQNMASLVTTMF